jgi:hypothetical protein
VSQRWEHCIWSRGDNAASLTELLGDGKRKLMLVGGAGFDPRASRVFRLLHPLLGSRIRAVLFREERPRPDRELVQRANRQLAVFRDSGVSLEVFDINIFATDGASVGGREAVARLATLQGLQDCTDIVVDFSALSLGVSFPITRYLLTIAEQLDANLHVVAVDSPETDGRIASVPTDKATPVHGCSGEWGLDGSSDATKLWLPLLAEGSKCVLERIYRTISPDDTCPILPFPSRDPRRGDKLLLEYWDEIESNWQIGPQNLIYAAESDPVDLYRSILRVDDARRGVFRELGGSLTILSPLGTKVMAIGAFMAAVDRDLPVFYVEAHAYSIPPDLAEETDSGVEVVHVWLAGEPYAELDAPIDAVPRDANIDHDKSTTPPDANGVFTHVSSP